MSLYTENVQQYVKVVRLERFWALWKEQNEAFPTVPPAGQTDEQLRVGEERGTIAWFLALCILSGLHYQCYIYAFSGNHLAQV
jgi:hypothetical protein